jgi:hypothetical protein
MSEIVTLEALTEVENRRGRATGHSVEDIVCGDSRRRTTPYAVLPKVSAAPLALKTRTAPGDGVVCPECDVGKAVAEATSHGRRAIRGELAEGSARVTGTNFALSAPTEAVRVHVSCGDAPSLREVAGGGCVASAQLTALRLRRGLSRPTDGAAPTKEDPAAGDGAGAERSRFESGLESSDELAAILAGPLPNSPSDAYRFCHPLVGWITAAYPDTGDAWERQLAYAVDHAADVRAGRLSLERYRRTLSAIARDPDGRRFGRRAATALATSPSEIDQLPSVTHSIRSTESFGQKMVMYVSTAVAWQLPSVIGGTLEESTDLLVDLACRVAAARSKPFDMGVLINRATWGRWRASSVLAHLPDRTRRSVAHIVCGHPSAPESSAIYLMHTIAAAEVPLNVVAWWRGDLPGLHPNVQQSYGRNEINLARLGTPPAAAEITRRRLVAHDVT